MTRATKILTGLLLATALWGCEHDDRYDVNIELEKTVTLSGGIVLHESTLDRLVYLSVTRSKYAIEELYRIDDEEELVWMKGGPLASAPTELFALSVPTDERDSERTETLLRVPVDGEEITRYPLGSTYDRFTVESSGRFGILYHSGSGDSGAELYNPNEVALVDLSKGPGKGNPRTLSIELGGRQVTGVTFLDPVPVGGVERHFVAVTGDGAFRLVDLNDLGTTGALIPMTDKDDLRSVVPVEFLVRPEDGERETMIFVRASGAEDIYAVSLSPSADGKIPYSATLNQFEAGGEPQDMVITEDDGFPLLVALSRSGGSSNVAVVDVDTSDAFAIKLEDSVNRALLQVVGGGPEVVFYGDNSMGVHFLTVKGVLKEKGRNLDDLWIPDQVSQAVLLGDGRLLIVPNDYRDLVLLELDTRESTRLSAPGDLDWSTAKTYKKKFFITRYDESEKIDVVDLGSGHPHTLILDDPTRSFHLLAGTGMGVAIHETPSGRATVFPLADPTRAEARIVDGIWLDGFLNEKEVPR